MDNRVREIMETVDKEADKAVDLWSKRYMLIAGSNRFSELANQVDKIEDVGLLREETDEFQIETFTVRIRKIKK